VRIEAIYVEMRAERGPQSKPGCLTPPQSSGTPEQPSEFHAVTRQLEPALLLGIPRPCDAPVRHPEARSRLQSRIAWRRIVETGEQCQDRNRVDFCES
jgi:hypothetical protein